MKSFVTKRLRVIRILREEYENWMAITAHYILARDKPVSLRTRDGRLIEGMMIRDISNALALPSLLGSGWSFKRVDSVHALLESPGKTSVKCRLGSGADIAHMATIFVEEAYKTDLEDKVVIDVGASNGDSPLYYALKGARKVIALEPSKDSYYLAVENITANKETERIILLNKALSVTTGHADLHTSSGSPNANTLFLTRLTQKINVFDGSEKVATINLQDLITSQELEVVDLLKLDCEGAEYELVRAMPHSTLANIGEIMLEYHEGAKDLPRILRENGFEVTTTGGSSELGYLHAKRKGVSGSTSRKAVS